MCCFCPFESCFYFLLLPCDVTSCLFAPSVCCFFFFFAALQSRQIAPCRMDVATPLCLPGLHFPFPLFLLHAFIFAFCYYCFCFSSFTFPHSCDFHYCMCFFPFVLLCLVFFVSCFVCPATSLIFPCSCSCYCSYYSSSCFSFVSSSLFLCLHVLFMFLYSSFSCCLSSCPRHHLFLNLFPSSPLLVLLACFVSFPSPLPICV